MSSANNSNDLLKQSLIAFYSHKENIDRIVPIINKTSPVSLRVLDWFIVNYARENQVVYKIDDRFFHVHASYKAQLKSYSKKQFDPFRRNMRLDLYYNDDKDHVETTIGQLCFFRWCLQFGILDYVEKHIHSITEDMKLNLMKDDSDDNDDENANSEEKSAAAATDADAADQKSEDKEAGKEKADNDKSNTNTNTNTVTTDKKKISNLSPRKSSRKRRPHVNVTVATRTFTKNNVKYIVRFD